MTDWVKFTDAWIGDPDTEALGADAICLHQSALSLSSRHRTDGWVADQSMRHLFPVADTDAVITRLIKADLWVRRDGGYHLVTWEKHLLSKEELVKRYQSNLDSSERYRRHMADDHSKCDRCAVIKACEAMLGDASRDGSGDAQVIAPSSLLSSSPRTSSLRNEVEKGRGERREGGSTSQDNGSLRSAAASSPPPPEVESNDPSPPWSGPPSGTRVWLDDGEVVIP